MVGGRLASLRQVQYKLDTKLAALASLSRRWWVGGLRAVVARVV